MIIAFTGAGISKSSGIDTFEDQEGLRDKLTRTFARMHTSDFKQVITNMQEACDRAEPNDAHKVLAEYKVPIITMNVDGLHKKAGSQHILPIHGELPNIVLYGDPAPLYSKAKTWVSLLRKNDILLIIGVSFYTNIAEDLKILAEIYGSDVRIINEKSEVQVREFLEQNIDKMETFDKLKARLNEDID